jgi:hypothetical protein
MASILEEKIDEMAALNKSPNGHGFCCLGSLILLLLSNEDAGGSIAGLESPASARSYARSLDRNRRQSSPILSSNSLA